MQCQKSKFDYTAVIYERGEITVTSQEPSILWTPTDIFMQTNTHTDIHAYYAPF
jgi:hypothetical protein